MDFMAGRDIMADAAIMDMGRHFADTRIFAAE
jgi:hypothetical protein